MYNVFVVSVFGGIRLPILVVLMLFFRLSVLVKCVMIFYSGSELSQRIVKIDSSTYFSYSCRQPRDQPGAFLKHKVKIKKNSHLF